MTRSNKPVTTGRGGFAARTLDYAKSSSAVKLVATSMLPKRAQKATSSGSANVDRLEIVDLSAEQVKRIEEICEADANFPSLVRDAISKPWKVSRG